MLIIQTYIKELKYLLYYILISITLTTTVIYAYNYEILYIISKPLILQNNTTENFDFIFTNIFEAFKTYILLSLFMSLIFNIPFIIWNIISFLIKGLYKTEAKQIYTILKLFTLFIIINNWIFYTVLYPIIINFLLQYENLNNFLPLNINMQLKLDEYLTIFLKLTCSYNLTLTLPWVLLFNKNTKWVYYKKYIYILTLILIAIVTPPDIFSLILFIIPIFCILEVTHLIKKIKY